jgi:hypothetical protein
VPTATHANVVGSTLDKPGIPLSPGSRSTTGISYCIIHINQPWHKPGSPYAVSGYSDPGHDIRHMECIIREAIDIKFHLDNMNREEGFSLSKSWKSLLQTLKE